MPLKINFFISHQTQQLLKLKSGKVTPYTDTLNYSGNTICCHDENIIIDNAITDRDRRLNHVFVEF